MRPTVRRLSYVVGSKRSSLTSLIERRVQEIPTKNCVFYEGKTRWSVQKVKTHSQAFGVGLVQLSHPGKDNMLVLLPSKFERLILQVAASYAGYQVFLVDKYSTDLDVAALLRASQPRSLFVSQELVPKVRDAVPELTLASKAKTPHPNHFTGNFNDGSPISALDFPYLKYAFHSGDSREPRFVRSRDILMYNPLPDPFEEQWVNAGTARSLPKDTDPFMTILTSSGSVKKSYTTEDVMNEAKAKVKSGIQADQSILLENPSSPDESLIGVLACIDSQAQLIVPDDQAPSQELKNVEKVVASV